MSNFVDCAKLKTKYKQIIHKIMKLRSLFAAVMASAMAFVACENGKVDLGTPSIALSQEEVTLEAAGGEATVEVTATRDWTVKFDETADWLVVDPASGTASADAQKVTVSALSNEGYDREVSVEFSIGMPTKYLTVKQAGPKGSADALVIYSNDYDKEVAQKTYGSGSSWPYLDQFEGWKNQKGTGAANVTYAFSGMSARSNSTSDSSYSDYPGSGNNNMFFGKSAYFATHGIALGEAKDLELTFGTEKYSQDNGSLFKNEEFHIWLSADGGAKWVELTDYTFAGGTTEGRWNVATANFSVPAGTAALSICMAVDVASSYRMDDFKLVASAKEGTAVDFSKAVAKDFGAGSTGGDNTGGNTGGEVTPPTGAIFFESFASGKGNFTIDDKTLPEGLTYVWYEDTQYKNMKASAFKDEVKYATESWLISPEVDLTSVTAAYLLFEHTGKYFGTMADEATVYAKKAGGEWAKLTIPTYMSGNDWTFVSSGAIDLKDYVGGKMQFAFKYVSTSNAAGTWEIKNVCVSPTAESTGGNTDGGNTDGGNTGGGTGGDNTGGENTEVDGLEWTVNEADKAYVQSATVNGESVSVVKLGASSAVGKATLTVPAGSERLTFYAVSWKSKPASLKLSAGGTEITTISPAANDGAYDQPPYTITVGDSDKFEVDIPENVTEILFETTGSNKRVIIFNVVAE